MKKPILIFLFLISPACSFADTDFPFIEGDISLTASSSPYVLFNQVTIATGTKLNIEPGVIIKSGDNGAIVINGEIVSLGTKEAPIVFTSTSNEPIGGDWIGIKINGIADFSNTEIKYAGKNVPGNEQSGLFIYDGTVRIANSKISHNLAKNIYINAGNVNVDDSEISNATYGIIINSGNLYIDSSNFHDHADRAVTTNNPIGDLFITNSIFTNNYLPVDMYADTNFVHSGNSASGNIYNAFSVGGSIEQNITLTKDGVPYFIVNFDVGSSTVLTIDKGACLKMDVANNFYIQGSLVVSGTKNEPVYFTSLKDDSVCGDTNNNLANSVPIAGDWHRVFVKEGGTLSASYLNVQYGGAFLADGLNSNIVNAGGSVILNNSTSSNSLTSGFMQASGSSTVFATGFVNQGVGIRIDGGEMAVRKSSFENHSSSAIDTSNITDASTTIDATKNWWGDEGGPRHWPEKVSGNGQWVNGDNIDFSNWLSANPKTWAVDPVVVIPGILGSWKDWRGIWRLDPITHTYDNLVDTLKTNGYVQGSTLYEFPYDWEKSNVDTAILLKQKIADIKALCGCGKVDIVAHSMGGLVARQYIQSADYQNDVDQIIFLGTPHLGSVFAYLAYGGGDVGNSFNDNTLETALRYIGLKRYGYIHLVDYVSNKILSMKELLPITNYLSLESGTTLNYPNGYPTNIFLENLDSNLSLLPQRVRKIINFVGDIGTTSTKISLTIASSTDNNKWQDGEPVETKYGNGDNRVSTTSARRAGGIINNHNIEHNKLPAQLSRNVAEELLFNDEVVNIEPKERHNYLLLLVNSPIDITVTSPSGQTYGAGGLDNDSVFYANSGDEEFLVVDNPEQGGYPITAIGTGQGDYSIDAVLINDSSEVSSTISGVTNLGQVSTSSIVVSGPSVQIVAPNNTEPNNLEFTRQGQTISSIKSTINSSVEIATTSTTTIAKKPVLTQIQSKVTTKTPVLIGEQSPKQIQIRNTASVQTGWELIKNLLKSLLRK